MLCKLLLPGMGCSCLRWQLLTAMAVAACDGCSCRVWLLVPAVVSVASNGFWCLRRLLATAVAFVASNGGCWYLRWRLLVLAVAVAAACNACCCVLWLLWLAPCYGCCSLLWLLLPAMAVVACYGCCCLRRRLHRVSRAVVCPGGTLSDSQAGGDGVLSCHCSCWWAPPHARRPVTVTSRSCSSSSKTGGSVRALRSLPVDASLLSLPAVAPFCC